MQRRSVAGNLDLHGKGDSAQYLCYTSITFLLYLSQTLSRPSQLELGNRPLRPSRPQPQLFDNLPQTLADRPGDGGFNSDAEPGNCRASGLVSAFEKVGDL